MSQAPSRRRRLPAFAATTAMVAAFLPASSLPANAATAEARSIDDGCPEQRVPSAGFSDTRGTVFEHEIDCVAWYGIASGNSQGQYSASAGVTRGAMAKFLINVIRASDKLVDPTPPDAFDDDNGHAFELEINQLVQLGVVGGSRDSDDVDNDGDTNELVYLPQNLVSRAQMATFINKTHEVINGSPILSADDFFTDDNGTFHEDNINAIASVGVGTGINQTTFGINGTVSRGAMAAFLSREVDYLVELGDIDPPVTGNADVILNSLEINQGRQVTGRVVTENDVPVAEMLVDICDGAFGDDVNAAVDNNLFTFTLPFNTTPGSCELDFAITLGSNARAFESHVITVIETEKILAGPELISLSVDTVGADTVTIRFEFDTEINPAVEPSKFRLYSFSGTQFPASAANKTGPGTVEAIFTRAQYDDATTGGLDRFAVQDLNGLNNAEYGFGLKAEELAAGETSYPDLVSVAGSGQQLIFTLDAPAFSVGPEDFAAVYVADDDGAGPNPARTSTVTGSAINAGGEGSATFTVTFPAPANGVAVRGVLKADSIGFVADGDTDNARQSADLDNSNQGLSPHLTSVILDPAGNKAQFVFSEAVSANAAEPVEEDPTCMIDEMLPTCTPAVPGRGLAVYDTNGDQFISYNVTQGSSNTLIATYAAGVVSGLIAGGSADQDVAIAQRNNALRNGVDEIGRTNTFPAGRTAAPDLLSVARTSDADGNLRVSFTFDQSFIVSTGTGGNPKGAFALYQNDNTRTVIDPESDDVTCAIDGVQITCILAQDSEVFVAAQTARYASASYAAVNAGGNTRFNPEAGYAFS